MSRGRPCDKCRSLPSHRADTTHGRGPLTCQLERPGQCHLTGSGAGREQEPTRDHTAGKRGAHRREGLPMCHAPNQAETCSPRTSAQSPFLSLGVRLTDPARVSPGLRRCLLPPQPPGLRVAQGQGSRPGRASPSPSEPALLAPARGPRPPAWGSSPDPRGPVCQGPHWALGGHSAMTRHLLTQPRAPSRDL